MSDFLKIGEFGKIKKKMMLHIGFFLEERGEIGWDENSILMGTFLVLKINCLGVYLLKFFKCIFLAKKSYFGGYFFIFIDTYGWSRCR